MYGAFSGVQNLNPNATPTFSNIISDNPATIGSHVPRWDQVQDLVGGISWQEPVKDRFDPTGGLPSSPSTGDRYISTATANGWTDKYIYEWNGASWDETVPTEGFAAWVEDEDKQYVYNGTNWVLFGSTITHDNLLGVHQDVNTTASPTFADMDITGGDPEYNTGGTTKKFDNVALCKTKIANVFDSFGTSWANIDTTNYALDLPTAGTYRISGTFRYRTTGGSDFGRVRLYNNTDAAAIADTQRMMLSPAAGFPALQISSCLDWFVTVTAPKTIYLQGIASAAGTVGIQTDTNGYSDFAYIRLS